MKLGVWLAFLGISQEKEERQLYESEMPSSGDFPLCVKGTR